jgi:heavy metal translocating P-type ATPase
VVAAAGVICSLCGLHTYHPLPGKGGEVFCCHACQEVAGLLKENSGKAQSTGVKGDNLTTHVMKLSGLWCSSCAWLIEETLKSTRGVGEARVSFLQLQARIEYDPAVTKLEQIRRKVRRLGYQAYLEGEKQADEEDAFFTRMLVGGMLAMHIMTSSGIIYIRQALGLASPDSHWMVEFFQWMEFALSIPLAIILGLPILRAGLASLFRGMPNIHTLVALGTFSALILSTRNLLLNNGQVFFDTAAMLLFLLSVGHWLEMQAYKNSRQAVRDLAGQLPDEARILTGGDERVIPASQLSPGNRLLIKPGERFPADGYIAAGWGDVDESMLSGEPKPNLKRGGEPVFAGTLSLDGAFEVIVSSVGANTRAGQIGGLLHRALWQRSPVERLADRLAAYMVPVAALLASGTFLYWKAQLGIEAGLMNALAVLLIACPCALALATPLTLWQALARAAQNGVILRSTGVLERLSMVTEVFFDKTGTLTRLPLRLKSVAVDGETEESLLSKVAAAESKSEHPIAEAIMAGVKIKRYNVLQPADFRAVPGAGVQALVEGNFIWAGSRKLMELEGLTLPEGLRHTAETWQSQGSIVVYAGWDGRVRGILALGERVRPEAAATLAEFQKQGMRVSILTGDSEKAGARWQEWLNIPVEAGLSPEEKLARIQTAGKRSVMLGDGINDGPALAAAGVGISLAKGTEVAQSAAEVVLVRDDLRLAPWLIELARGTRRKVHQNLFWAFAYNMIGLALAVGGLLQPVVGAAAMVISSLLVTQNALRLRNFPLLVDGEAAPVVLVDPSAPAAVEELI